MATQKTKTKPIKKPAKQPKAQPSFSALKRALTATNKRAEAAEGRAADGDVAAATLVEIATTLEQRLGLVPPMVVLPEIDKLLARVAATTSWTKLAHGRLTKLLGYDYGSKPTLGSVLELIERLGEDRKAANDLIARLAFNLSEGPEQEQIEAADPTKQRAVVEAKAFELAELSLLREMAQGAEVTTYTAEHQTDRALLARIAAFVGNGTQEDLLAMDPKDLRVVVEQSVFEDKMLQQVGDVYQEFDENTALISKRELAQLSRRAGCHAAEIARHVRDELAADQRALADGPFDPEGAISETPSDDIVPTA